MLDVNVLIEGIEDAARNAVADSLERVAERARMHAPVRKIFKGGRKRTITTGGPLTSSGMALNESRGPAFEYRNRSARRVVEGLNRHIVSGPRALTRHSVVTEGGVSSQGFRRVPTEAHDVGGTGRGRANSAQPVVLIPGIGRLMGDFRTLSAPGQLAAHAVFARVNGRTVRGDVSAQLTGRAKYDLKKGRGVTSEDELGGTLRDSIEVEGPVVTRGEVYGFVKAAAFNEQGFNYALAQEIGTAHNRPQPFLRPALRELRDEILTAERNVFEAAFRKASSRRRGGFKHLRRTVKLEVELANNWSKLGADLNVRGLPVEGT